MGWRTAWKAISDRIEGLLEAVRFFVQSHSIRTATAYGKVEDILWRDSMSIYEEINKYKKTYEQYLSNTARSSIDRFDKYYNDSFNSNIHTLKIVKIMMISTALASFRSEFSFHLSNMQEVTKRTTERAFIHLQRLIIADEDIQSKWIKAFKKDEPACEKLGAAHLLLHGIWAFKAKERGEETDLILGEPIRNILTQVESTAEALVLTEWKKVSKPGDLNVKAEQAFKQASIYGDSLLGGLELAGYRYLVLVSEDRLEIPANRIEKEVTYRYINIAVKPKSPSKTRRTQLSSKS